MRLDHIMREMSMEAEPIGIQEFDTLGLVNTQGQGRICTFVGQEKYIEHLSEDIALILTTKDLKEKVKDRNLCLVDNPALAFFRLHNFISAQEGYERPTYDTILGENCRIHPLSCIAHKNVTIGNNVVIEEFVSIKEHVTIGDDSIIRAGTIIGGEGFEQKKDGEAALSVKHLGGVVIGQNVELQQSSCVDKAVFPWDNTIIADDCRIDNLVHIAHGVKMQERVFVAAHTCIAGRVSIGKDVWIGPGVTIINGISIGNNARINIGAVATQDVKEQGQVTGNFAIDHTKFIENLRTSR